MGDLISRRAAIDAIGDAEINFSIESNIDLSEHEEVIQQIVTNILEAQEEALRDLPSAEPKKGKWIVDGIETQTIDAVKAMFQVCICSECGGASARATNFCPICGADMRED